MPTYEYTCKDCKRDFIVIRSLKEAEERPAVKCEHCGSEKVEKKYSAFTAVTSKKS
jgi:putative FmdB family regulatory protein